MHVHLKTMTYKGMYAWAQSYSVNIANTHSKPLYKFSGLVELMHSTNVVSEMVLCLQNQPTQNVYV